MNTKKILPLLAWIMFTHAPDTAAMSIDIHVSGLAGSLVTLQEQSTDISLRQVRDAIVEKTGFADMFYFIVGTSKAPTKISVLEEPAKKLQDLFVNTGHCLLDSEKGILPLEIVKAEGSIEDMIELTVMSHYPEYVSGFKNGHLPCRDSMPLCVPGPEILTFRFYHPSKGDNTTVHHRIYFLVHEMDSHKILAIISKFCDLCCESDNNGNFEAFKQIVIVNGNYIAKEITQRDPIARCVIIKTGDTALYPMISASIHGDYSRKDGEIVTSIKSQSLAEFARAAIAIVAQ